MKNSDSLKSLRRKKVVSEDFFLKNMDLENVPKHVAIIMDGNGRWASKKGLPRLAGHRAGASAVREVVKAAPIIGVEYLTLYTFSAENWNRPRKEVSGLMRLFEEMLKREIDELDANNVQIRLIGRFNEMPDSTRDNFINGVRRTSTNTGLKLIIALNYGGRTEIVDAVKKLMNIYHEGKIAIDDVSDELVSKALYTTDIPDPDLIIRTSGELRLSNFLIWQSAYSEFWVTGLLWPDFKRVNFYEAVYDYQRRERRFGGDGKVLEKNKGS